MAHLSKDRARKPLATGKVTLSYGMNCDKNNGTHGIGFRMHNEDGNAYTLQITNDELDKAILLRQQFGEHHEANFSTEALNTSHFELVKDDRNNMPIETQTAKALDMALTLLRTFMPPTEQDRNATLAYVVAVNDKAQA